jgi:hypothetical protein
MKHCITSADVGPAFLVGISSDFIDLTGELKADIGAACGYALGIAHTVTGTKHIVLVDTEGLEENHQMLRSGGDQDVPSYKAAAQQQHVNNDASSCTMGKSKTGQESTTHLYSNVSNNSKSLLAVKASFS